MMAWNNRHLLPGKCLSRYKWITCQSVSVSPSSALRHSLYKSPRSTLIMIYGDSDDDGYNDDDDDDDSDYGNDFLR